ncbi:MAG: hypothetical protein AAB465_03315 [Patescibacteria group bacterium]
MSAELFPTIEEAAFIKRVSDFCQRKYGFSVPQVFSVEGCHQRKFYLVMVCPKYSFWPNDTLVKDFYVYYGHSKDQADAVSRSYLERGFDVYIRDDCEYFSGAPENSIVITPKFFESLSYVWSICTLIHESFHHYVHKDDIGLERYGQHMTFDELVAEESLATVIGHIGTLEYLTEIKASRSLLKQARRLVKKLGPFHALINGQYQKLDKVYRSDNDSLKAETKRQIFDGWFRGGNAEFLIDYLYYGSSHMAKYLKLLAENKRRSVFVSLVENFAQTYWLKLQRAR